MVSWWNLPTNKRISLVTRIYDATYGKSCTAAEHRCHHRHHCITLNKRHFYEPRKTAKKKLYPVYLYINHFPWLTKVETRHSWHVNNYRKNKNQNTDTEQISHLALNIKYQDHLKSCNKRIRTNKIYCHETSRQSIGRHQIYKNVTWKKNH